MNSELLVQRFVDQELTAEERVQLLVQLGRDVELRRRAIALERLSLDASQLPRPLVPEGFVDAVLAQTTQQPWLWTRAIAPLWAPRVLRWNLVGAAAAAVLVVLLAGAFGMSGQRSSTSVPEIAAVPPARVLVRLVVVQPGARTVQAAGDFNGWNPGRTPLEPASNGAWTVTIPLEPGRYEYQFVVNGEQWIADPFATEQSDDGFGSRNAVLDVRPVSEESL